MASFKKRETPVGQTIQAPKLSSSISAEQQRKLDDIARNTETVRQPVAALQPDAPYTLDEVFHIPLGKLRENEWNSRQIFSQADHETMVAQLSNDGQLDDCAGYVDGQNVVLFSGHRRLRAAKTLQWVALRVRIVAPPADPLEAFIKSDQYNSGHRQQSVLDRALAFAKLIENKKAEGPKELALKCKLDESYVVRVLSLSKLPQEIIVVVADVPSMLTLINLYEVYLFYKACGLAETMKLLANVKETPLSTREIARLRKQFVAQPKLRPRSAKQTFAYGRATGSLRRFEADGRLELSISGLTAQELNELELKIVAATNASPELDLHRP